MLWKQASHIAAVPGIQVDRQCAAGLNAIAYAAILVEAGYGEVFVAGGVESDSTRVYLMRNTLLPRGILQNWLLRRLLCRET